MVMRFLKNIKNFPLLWISLLLFALLLLLGKQGFDVVDEGWYLTFYQQFFNHPESVEYNFVFYYTGLIGGIWFELFSDGGVFSFRILAALTITMIFSLSYVILKNHISRVAALTGLLMVMFVTDFGYLSFYYNHLSGLLGVAIVGLLVFGLSKNNKVLILMAGVITAANIFVRLPNFTLLALVLIIPLYHFWAKTAKIKSVITSQLFIYCLGVILGFLITYLIMICLGHYSIYEKSLMGIFDKGQNEGSNHNISTLFSVYLKNYLLVAKKMFKLIILFIVLLGLRSFLSTNKTTRLLWYIFGVIGFIYVFNSKTIYAVYALIFLMSALYFLNTKKTDPSFKALTLLSLTLIVLMPLGSDGGINNAGYMSIWLMLPITIDWLRKADFISVFQYLRIETGPKTLRPLPLLIPLIVGFFLTRIYSIANNAYFDHGSRLEKTFIIESPLAKGIYTTERRSKIINEVVIALKAYVKKDDYLLAYDKIPMLNYLSETRPYMYNSWVWVYDGVTFKKQLSRAQTEISILPVVVQQKFETIDNFSEPITDYMSENKEASYYYDRNRVNTMNKFLIDNNYKLVWSSDYFNIYQPGKDIDFD